jgi:tRNA pseudouridine32 synthase/23S rRNA pseudouridine746 synthase
MLLSYHPPLTPYLDILYQDEQILVLNKPSGLLSVPGKAAEHYDSLEYRVKRVWPLSRIVHRLDMATSGLIVMAMTADSQRHLNRQFQLRQTSKHYIARVSGQVKSEQGSIELPLICDWPERPKQKVCYQYGKPSLTRYKILTREPQATRLQLEPVTGRSHQLRVHMLWLGHPILGDKFYGTEISYNAAPRLQLHAAGLSLRHPLTEQYLTFNSPCPF